MSQSDKDADLSGAIKQLEALLDAHPDQGGETAEQLPVLDEIVDPDNMEAASLEETFEIGPSVLPAGRAGSRPDPVQIRAALERVASEMETELENAVGLLQNRMLQRFRNELAEALNMDPQELDNLSGKKQNKHNQ